MVEDVNEAPELTGDIDINYLDNGIDISYLENGIDEVIEFTAKDPEGGTVIWGFSGTDQDDFTFDTGKLRFVSSPDREIPTDQGGDNTYDVVVTVSDGAQSADVPVTAGITTGCGIDPLRFCPDRAVTRAQTASFLARALDLVEVEQLPSGFVDVDSSSVHASSIDALFAAGITTGCGIDPLRFCPDRAVTRAQMASFLIRALNPREQN